MNQPIWDSRSHVIMGEPDDCFDSSLQDDSTLERPWVKPDDLLGRIWTSVYRDDKDAFLRLLKDPRFESVAETYDCFSTYAKTVVFDSDAVNIAIAVLNGETKGIIEFQDVVDGVTLLHVAAFYGAPKITKYLLQRGDNVDVICDYRCRNSCRNLKQATPIDVAVEFSTICYNKTQDNPLFRMLWKIFVYRKKNLEVIRLLVQHSENKERVRQAFINYAHQGQLFNLILLFLAVPELCVLPYLAPLGIASSPYSTLYLELNSLEKKTDIQEGLSLLLDVFAVIGDKLVAYIRLEEIRDFREENIYKIKMGIDFLLREAAGKKLGVSTSDYYFRFFQPLIPKASDDRSQRFLHGFDECTFALTASKWYKSFAHLLERKDFDKADIYRVLPTLDDKIVGRVDGAIKKRLISLSTLQGYFETLAKISNGEEKHPPPGLLFPYGKSLERSLMKPVSAYKSTLTSEVMKKIGYAYKSTLTNEVMKSKPGYAYKSTLTNEAMIPGLAYKSSLTKKVMKPGSAYKSTLTNETMIPEKSTLTNEVIRWTKLKSLFSTRGLYNVSIIAKRVTK